MSVRLVNNLEVRWSDASQKNKSFTMRPNHDDDSFPGANDIFVDIHQKDCLGVVMEFDDIPFIIEYMQDFYNSRKNKMRNIPSCN